MQISTYWTATSLAICSFLACIIMAFPLWLKIRARNIPLITTVGSWLVYWLLRATNSLIWRTDGLDEFWLGEGLCDVEVQVLTALGVSTSSGLLCLFRQLSRLMKPSRLGVKPSETEKRRTLIFEIFFCIALPILSMPAAFIVQSGRYAIGPVIGCVFVYEQTLEAYFLYQLWPIAMDLIALIYATLTLIRIATHYRGLLLMFSELPQGSRMKREIVKTCIFAFVLYLVRTPYTLFTFVTRNKLVKIQPFSWSYIHSPDWSDRIWLLNLPSKGEAVFGFTSVIFALLALWCFGTGQDAKDELRLWNSWLGDVWKRFHRGTRRDEG